MVKTAVLVSGGGTNLQAILDAHLFGEIKNCELTAVISSSPDAYALQRAERANVPAYIVDRDIFPNRESFCEAMVKKLIDLDIELVVLAGFMYTPTITIIEKYKNRIINTHPSLLPSFCGDDYYGAMVYEEAIKRGVKYSGATAYFVTKNIKDSPIILQKPIEVKQDDTPDSLQLRIMKEGECQILPKAISLFCEGRLENDGVTVKIKPNENEKED